MLRMSSVLGIRRMFTGNKGLRAAKVLCATAFAIWGALAGSASASNLYQGPASYSAGPYNWSGFYVGGVIGYNWGEDRTTEYVTATGTPRNIFFDYTTQGVSGGLKAGINFQTGAFVYGLEGDFEATDITGGFIDRIENLGKGVDKYHWQASIRGRLGYAFDRVLVYGTGGVSYAKIENTYTLVPFSINESIEGVHAGWNVGGGIDYAIDENLIAGFEYRYTEFHEFRNVSTQAFPGLTGGQEPTLQSIRASLSYKF